MPTREQIEFHYRLEKELAKAIMDASPEDRAHVSLEAYDELFAKITWHEGHQQGEELTRRSLRSYGPIFGLIGGGRDVLEIGCGSGAQLRRLSHENRRCVGIDISREILEHQSDMPGNVELMVADACDMPSLPANAFDVAFSKQLIEHLHPDDVARHFGAVSRVLRDGGRYILETPSRLTGPHDVSVHFDDVATGFHLCEYTYGEIIDLLRAAGFKRFRSPLMWQSVYNRAPGLVRFGRIPAGWLAAMESLVRPWPVAWRRRAGRLLRISSIFVEAHL